MERKGPNFFLAFQITNPGLLESLRGVQYNCVLENRKLKELIAPLETAHVGIGVFRVEDERLEEVKTILRDVFEKYRAEQEEDDKRSVTFKGLDMFGESVLFAKPDRGTEFIRKLHKISNDALKKAEIKMFEFENFNPHITLFKSNNHLREIPTTCKEAIGDVELGSQDVEDIGLLSIPKPREDNGYYYTEEVYNLV